MKIKLIKFKNVKSTNDEAIRLIKKKAYVPTIITAENQKKGRGTMGKKWKSMKGNIFISIFFKLNQKKINFKQFAVLNALLIKKIVSSSASKSIKIKWPNDILFQKKKFCGILQEVINYENFDYLIVGIGLNTNIAPQNKSFSSTCLKNIVGKKISNTKMLYKIKNKYEKFLKEINYHSFSYLKKKYK